MDFQEAVEKIEESQHFPRNATLERIKASTELLDHPEKNLKFIHIAGTNGKGSTGALIKAGLEKAGYLVGSFTSPHLLEITERIRLGNEAISKESFAEIYSNILSSIESLSLSFFEQLTLIALCYFAKTKPDYIIWETGLGGRLDATNIVKPEITVITPIGLDHMSLLGGDLVSIAKEKAAIIKPNTKAVIAPQKEGITKIFTSHAIDVGAPIIIAEEFLPIYFTETGITPSQINFPSLGFTGFLSLFGRHQAINALTALLVLRELGLGNLQDPYLFAKVNWPGRLQFFPELNLLIDGAHNEPAMEPFVTFIREQRLQNSELIFAAMVDKDYFNLVKQLDGIFKKVYLPHMTNKRAIEPEKLAVLFNKTPSLICNNVSEALDLSLGKGLVILVGSLYLVGECLKIVNKKLDIKD